MTRSVPRESSGTNPRYRAASESIHRAKTTSIRDMRKSPRHTLHGCRFRIQARTHHQLYRVSSPSTNRTRAPGKPVPKYTTQVFHSSFAGGRRRRTSASRSTQATVRHCLAEKTPLGSRTLLGTMVRIRAYPRSVPKRLQSQAKQAVPAGGQGARIRRGNGGTFAQAGAI